MPPRSSRNRRRGQRATEPESGSTVGVSTPEPMEVTHGETGLNTLQERMERLENLLHQMIGATEANTPKPVEAPVPSQAGSERSVDNNAMSTPLLTVDLEHKALKKIDMKAGIFDPVDEKEFDDKLEEWERILYGADIPRETLIPILHKIAAPSLVRAAAQISPVLQWKDYKDQMARRVFSFSTQIKDIEAELMTVKEEPEPARALTKIEWKTDRLRLLYNRHNRACGLDDQKIREYMLNKLPSRVTNMIKVLPKWNEWSIDEFKNTALMVCDGMKTRIDRTVLANEPVVEITHADRNTFTTKARASFVCHNCGQPGHISKNCRSTRQTCSNCRRRGHIAKYCKKTTMPRPVGRQTAELIPKKRGFTLNVQDHQRKADLWETLREESENQLRQLKRSQKDGDIQGTATPPRKSARSENTPPLTEAEVNCLTNGGAVDALTISGIIGGLQTEFLVDTGSKICVLGHNHWRKLGRPYGSNANDAHTTIRTIMGSTPIITVVNLPVVVKDHYLEIEFFVVKSNLDLNILGIPWLQNVGCILTFKRDDITINFSDGQGKRELVEKEEVHSITTEEDVSSDDHKIKALLNKYKDIWSQIKYGQCTVCQHKIDVNVTSPIACKPRRLSVERQKLLRQHIKELIDEGIVVPSMSDWAFPVVMMFKPSGEMRMCIDYRMLNACTKGDAYPLPIIEDIFQGMQDANFFSVIDLKSGFYQVKLHEESREKTAFVTPEGLYEFVAMPFGLKNAPATFQRIMNVVLTGLKERGVCVYIDDIVVFTNDYDSHLDLLQEVFIRFKNAGLFINIKKSRFLRPSIVYLGYKIGGGKMSIDESRREAINRLTRPCNVKGIRRFLGAVGYFRKFVPRFARIAAPLYELLHQNKQWAWTNNCEQAYTTLKSMLSSSPVFLALADRTKSYILDTDASTIAIAGILMQKGPDGDQVIAYASRCLTETERNWPIRELEAYAIVWSITHFRSYLRDSVGFEVRTDHESLRWLWKVNDNRRIARWCLLLAEYNFSIRYRAGKQQQHVDIFTRDVSPDQDEETTIDKITVPRNTGRCVLANSLHESVEPFTPESKDCEVLRYIPSLDKLKTEVEEEIRRGHVKSTTLQVIDGIYVNHNDKIYVPMKYRGNIMYAYHYTPVGGHEGVTRTFNRMRLHFYWGSMKDDLQQFINNCLTCRRRRIPKRQNTFGTLKVLNPFDIVACDMVGPVNVRGQRRYYLTMIDHCSRYPEVAEVSGNITSKIIFKALYTKWFTVWGFPTSLLTDNAMVFKSQEIHKECARVGIHKIFASPHYPQGNGVIERFHGFLKHSLQTLSVQTDLSADEMLATALMIYRSTPHTDTKETPFYILTGLDMVLPNMQSMFRLTRGVAMEERLNLVKDFRKMLMEKIICEQNGKRESRSKPAQNFQVGDLIIYELPESKRNALSKITQLGKMTPHWSEPCRVQSVGGQGGRLMVRSIWSESSDNVFPIASARATKLDKRVAAELPPEWQLEIMNDVCEEDAANAQRNLVEKRLLSLPDGKSTKMRRALARVQEWGQAPPF